jgi:hypothetical protein
MRAFKPLALNIQNLTLANMELEQEQRGLKADC